MSRALAIFRALADSTRLRILALLRSMELSVGELAQVLGQSQPRVSRHVKILCDAGLAERRKEGSWVFVALGAPATVDPVLAALDGWGEPSHWAVADEARLAAVRADRASAAAEWFEANAGEWDAIRSLHVAEEQVEAAMARQLGDAPIGRLIDIGTGTGRMLELFAPGAEHALGIDRSSEMLRSRAPSFPSAGSPMPSCVRPISMRCRSPMAAPMPRSCTMCSISRSSPAPRSPRRRACSARRTAADRRFRPARARGIARARCPCPAGLLRRADPRLVRGAGLAPVLVETLEGGELTVKLWLARKTGRPNQEAKAA